MLESFGFSVGPGEIRHALSDFNLLLRSGKGIYATFRNIGNWLGAGKGAALTKSYGNGFVRYETEFLLKSYFAERENLLDPGVPYSKLFIWRDDLDVALKVNTDDFKLSKGDRIWNEMVNSGFGELRQKSAVEDFPDQQPIRLCKVDKSGKALEVQPALYSQQAKSNLLADYGYQLAMQERSQRTLREQLIDKYGQNLPPLSDKKLANTIGISALVLARDGDGNWRPLMHWREPEKSKAAMAATGIHCTGSKVAFWPNAEQEWCIDSFFTDEAYQSIKDYGLRRADVVLRPIGLLREHARLGKPQLVYIGITHLSIDAALERWMEYQEGLKNSPFAKYKNMKFKEFREFMMKDFWSEDTLLFTHEGLLALRLLNHAVME